MWGNEGQCDNAGLSKSFPNLPTSVTCYLPPAASIRLLIPDTEHLPLRNLSLLPFQIFRQELRDVFEFGHGLGLDAHEEFVCFGGRCG